MHRLGLASLTSAAANEVIILEAEPAEWSDQTGQQPEGRVNKLLDRDDLRFVRLLRAGEIDYPAALSFHDFRKVYREPRLTYSCPKCGVGEAVSDGPCFLDRVRFLATLAARQADGRGSRSLTRGTR